jgi:hypothetical protein
MSTQAISSRALFLSTMPSTLRRIGIESASSLPDSEGFRFSECARDVRKRKRNECESVLLLFTEPEKNDVARRTRDGEGDIRFLGRLANWTSLEGDVGVVSGSSSWTTITGGCSGCGGECGDGFDTLPRRVDRRNVDMVGVRLTTAFRIFDHGIVTSCRLRLRVLGGSATTTGSTVTVVTARSFAPRSAKCGNEV